MTPKLLQVQDVITYICATCRKTFTKKKSYNDHVRRHLPKKKSSSQSNNQVTASKKIKNQSLFSCSKCQSTFKQKRSLKNHLNKKLCEDQSTADSMAGLDEAVVPISLRTKKSSNVKLPKMEKVIKIILPRIDELEIKEFSVVNREISTQPSQDDVSYVVSEDLPVSENNLGTLYRCAPCRLTFKQKRNFVKHTKTKSHQAVVNSNTKGGLDKSSINETLIDFPKNNLSEADKSLLSLPVKSIFSPASKTKKLFSKKSTNNKPTLKQDSKNDGKPLYKCPFCNETFVSRTRFFGHKFSHVSSYTSKPVENDPLTVDEHCNDTSKEVLDLEEPPNDDLKQVSEDKTSKPVENDPLRVDEHCNDTSKEVLDLKEPPNDDSKQVSEDKDEVFVYMCFTCNRYYKNELKYNDHLLKHALAAAKNKKKCGNTVISNEAVDSNRKEESNIHCFACNKSFDNKQNYYIHHCMRHIKFRINSPYSKAYNDACDIPSEDSSNEDNPIQDDSSNYRDSSSKIVKDTLNVKEFANEKPPYNCPPCKLTFPNRAKFREHKKTHIKLKKSRDKVCNECGQTFSNSSSLKIHKKTDHKNPTHFICEFCGQELKNRSSLNLHNIKHSGIRPFSCTECDKSFWSKKNLRTHKIMKHSTSKPFLCSQCGRSFIEKISLRRHELQHRGILPYACKHCEARFNYKQALTNHYRFVHGKGDTTLQPVTTTVLPDSDELTNNSSSLESQRIRLPSALLKFVCQICDKKFSLIQSLEGHMNMHMGIKPFECDKCDKKYSTKASLTMHMRVRHGTGPYIKKYSVEQKKHSAEQKFSCDICQKTFLSKVNLKVHSIVHSNVKPFACSFCGRKFLREQQLQNHEYLHKEDRPYKCATCGKGFIQKKTLAQHDRVVHQGRRDHICKTCNKAFTTSSCLAEHEVLHRPEKKMFCQFCNKGFFHGYRLKAHIRKVHFESNVLNVDGYQTESNISYSQL